MAGTAVLGWLRLSVVLIAIGCTHAAQVTFDSGAVLHSLPATFLSFTIDAGQLFPGVFWNHSKAIDFRNPVLVSLTSALAPALLRVGGTDADRLFYDMSNPSISLQEAPPPPPAGYKYTLTQSSVKELFNFSNATGVSVVFGLNGGPGPRSNGVWQSSNARQLVSYACSRFRSNLAGFQLGNEPNLYLANFDFVLHGEQLVRDFRTLRNLLVELNCSAQISGPDIAEQILPEVLSKLPPTMDDFLSAGGAEVVDAVTYHWYPLDGRESSKWIDPWYATQQRAMSLQTLKRGEVLAQKIRSTVANKAPTWTGETALAAFGGQADTSQAWPGVLFWADAIGVSALNGQHAIIRQTLCGARYGLLDPQSGCTRPNPDYWVMLLWKQLMGSDVLRATSDDSRVRVYASIRADQVPALMLINTANSTIDVQLDLTVNGTRAKPLDGQRLQLYLLSHYIGEGLRTQRTTLNGEELRLQDNDNLPVVSPVATSSGKIVLTPFSVAFVLAKGAL